MKLTISPAKNMVQDADTLPPAAMPVFWKMQNIWQTCCAACRMRRFTA